MGKFEPNDDPAVQCQIRDWRAIVRRQASDLPRPLVLLHTIGNTNQDRKSLPAAMHSELYRRLLDGMEGTVIVLDWDERAPRYKHYRLRRSRDVFGDLGTPHLYGLMLESDLLIGVDSGPLHMAGLTGISRVGLFPPGHYPSTYLVPTDATVSLVLRNAEATGWNRRKRIPFRIVEHEKHSWCPSEIAEKALSVFQPRRYVPSWPRDLQLQQFVGWCRGVAQNGLSEYHDRQHSFDIVLREMCRRFDAKFRIVETGCIRAEEDWAGAGFSTYLLGLFCMGRGGYLDSVDTSETNVAFARDWVGPFGAHVRLHLGAGADWLRANENPIAMLYCDSCDTTFPEHAAVCLAEVEAGYAKLEQRALVVIDDTPWYGGAFVGKGALAVPWLLARGWRVLYGGYQVVLCRCD